MSIPQHINEMTEREPNWDNDQVSDPEDTVQNNELPAADVFNASFDDVPSKN